MPLEFRQGDTAEPIQGFLEEEDGTPLPDLDGAVVYAHLKAEDGTKLIDGEQGTVVDASTGEVKYEVVESEVDTPGDHELWWVVEYADGQVTVPSRGNLEVFIEEVDN